MKDITELKSFIAESESVHDSWRSSARICLNMERGDQWVDEDKQRLEEEERPVLTFNIMRPLVRLLTGMERKTRYDLRVLPFGEGSDSDVARMLTGIIKKVEDDNNAPYVYSDAYRMGLVTGRGWVKVDVSYDRNIYGDVVLSEVDSYELYIDPYARKYDLSDCKYLIRELFLTKDDVYDVYPDVDIDKLEAAQPDRGDIITEGREVFKFYEVWYKEYRNHWYLVRTDTGNVLEIDQEELSAIKEKIGESPALELRKFKRSEMYYAVITGGEILEQEKSPYGHNMFPYVPFFCDFSPRFGYEEKPTWHSIITDLIDPQREKNKRISLWVDILLRFINTGLRYGKGAVLNEDELDAMAKGSGFRLVMADGRWNEFERFKGEAPDAALLNYAAMQDQEVYRISGIPPAMWGTQESSRESGRTVMLRQQQGAAVLTPFQDNMRMTRKMVARQILALIPRVFSVGRLVRLLTESGETETRTLTEADVNKLKTIYRIKSDATLSLYDIALSDSPSTPTTRQAEFMELLELLKEGILPMTPNVVKMIIKVSDISLKSELLAVLEQEMAQQQQQQQQQAQQQQIQKAMTG